MSKVYVGVGHGGTDPGAVANGLKEKEVNLAISLACKAELERHDVAVKISRSTDKNHTVAAKVKECNAYNADLCVEIHNNAGGGVGYEVYYHHGGGKSLTLAKNISSSIQTMGQKAHGNPLKTKLMANGRDYFGMIRDTEAPAVLVECAFLDSSDYRMVNTAAKQKAFGVAIAHGVLKTLGISVKSTAISPSDAKRVKIGQGEKIYSVAGEVEKAGIYTIVDEAGGMGKLKSEAGWVNLSNVKKL